MTDRMRKARSKTAGVVLVAAVAAGVVGFLISRTGEMPQQPLQLPLASPTAVPFAAVSGPGFTAADDPAADQVVVFGGGGTYGNTWVWVSGRWTLTHPTKSPPGRSGATSAYDPVTRTVMLYGGQLQLGEMVDDTWSWNGSDWRELDSGTGHPPSSGVIAWDSPLNEMVLVGESGTTSTYETWEWSTRGWGRDAAGDFVAYGAALAFDPISGALIAITSTGPQEASTVTLQWKGSSWRRMTGVADPSIATDQPATVAGLALDPSIGRLLLTCTAAHTGAASQEWTWDGENWDLAGAVQLPTATYAEITDVSTASTLLIGSAVAGIQESPEVIHIWTWDGVGWRQWSSGQAA